MLQPKPGADPFTAFETRTAERVARYLQRADRLGPALEAQDLDDAGALLGRRPRSWQEADARLEAFALAAAPEADGPLVNLFYRRLSRHEALLQGALRELEDVRIEQLGASA